MGETKLVFGVKRLHSELSFLICSLKLLLGEIVTDGRVLRVASWDRGGGTPARSSVGSSG